MKLQRFVIADPDGVVTGTATGTRESVLAAYGPGWSAIRSDAPDPLDMKLVKGRLRPRGKIALSEAAIDAAWTALRVERARLLAACDWTQTLDQPEALRAAWAVYRQRLRDLPDTITDPRRFNWPLRPNQEGFEL